MNIHRHHSRHLNGTEDFNDNMAITNRHKESREMFSYDRTSGSALVKGEKANGCEMSVVNGIATHATSVVCVPISK